MEDIVLNHLAILTAAVSAFVLGGLWYSPILFSKAWKNANGFGDDIEKKGNPAVIFGVAFVLTVIMAYNLGYFLSGAETNLSFGLAAGAATGIGWVAPSFIIVSLFERRPAKYWLVNGGYFVVLFILMGAIIGAWR